MDERGALKVNEYLQVEGHTDIFALGDCNNVAEMKLAVTADMQCQHLYKNLKLMFNQQKMTNYKPGESIFSDVARLLILLLSLSS